MDNLDFFDDVDDFAGVDGDFALGGDVNEDWLFVPMDLGESLAGFEEPEVVSEAGMLTELPCTILAKVFSFLEWGELLVLRLCWNKRVNEGVSLAWPSMARNTWRAVGRLPVLDAFGRLASSLVASVDRLRRGEMVAAVLAASFRALEEHADEEDDSSRRVKMARFENGRDVAVAKNRDAAAAKIIAVMYQSLLTTANSSKDLIKQVENALRKDCKSMARATVQLLADLDLLFSDALVAIKAYRKKILIPAAHLREIRRFEETIVGHVAHLAALRQGWKRGGGDQGAFPANLVFTKQQFGIVVRPTQKVAEHEVRLICAPNFDSEVRKCRLICVEQDDDKSANLDVLSGHDVSLSDGKVAVFDALKFTKPSRQKLVSLIAECDVKTKTGTVVLQSPRSYPMLVYAHQKQLVASFETLLTHCLFGEKSIISWPFFCNVVQEFFCTHLQSEDAPIESGKVPGLSSSDFEFMRSKFFGRAKEVRRDDAGPFFQFIGPFLFSLTINRAYVNLFREGYLAGFLSREAIDAELQSYGPGAFLLRYSTQVPGEIVISFVSGNSSTKHYLVGESDVSPKARHTLAAFLWKTPTLKHILRLPFCAGEATWGGAKLEKKPKEEVLKGWMDAIPNMVGGYDFQA